MAIFSLSIFIFFYYNSVRRFHEKRPAGLASLWINIVNNLTIEPLTCQTLGFCMMAVMSYSVNHRFSLIFCNDKDNFFFCNGYNGFLLNIKLIFTFLFRR